MSRRFMPDPLLKRQGVVGSTQVGSHAASAFGGLHPAVHAPLLQPRITQKRRAATAAAVKKEPYPMYVDGLEEPLQGAVRARPGSGPQVAIGLRPRTTLSPPQPPPLPIMTPLAWHGMGVREVPAAVVVSKVKNIAGLGLSRKPRIASLQAPSVLPFAARPKQRVRSPLVVGQQLHTNVQDKFVDARYSADLAAAPYAILSPNSAIAASAPSVTSRRPVGFFDPFEMMYPATAPDHLLTLATKRFVVGKLQCQYPAAVHFKTDRLCYIFIHPYQEGVQIMMELYYNDMVDLRCTTTGAASAFSFKVPHHLPSFDGYGDYGAMDYEPHLRNHRLTIDFPTQNDLAKFKAIVYSTIQRQAISKK